MYAGEPLVPPGPRESGGSHGTGYAAELARARAHSGMPAVARDHHVLAKQEGIKEQLKRLKNVSRALMQQLNIGSAASDFVQQGRLLSRPAMCNTDSERGVL